jgi:hypothetical protein
MLEIRAKPLKTFLLSHSVGHGTTLKEHFLSFTQERSCQHVFLFFFFLVVMVVVLGFELWAFLLPDRHSTT